MLDNKNEAKWSLFPSTLASSVNADKATSPLSFKSLKKSNSVLKLTTVLSLGSISLSIGIGFLKDPISSFALKKITPAVNLSNL